MSGTERQKSIEALAKAMAAKGIPPFLVASNITVPEYTSIHLWKENGRIYVRSVCTDDEAGELQFTYHYDDTVTLQKIVMTVKGRDDVYYDRQAELRELASRVVKTRKRCLNCDGNNVNAPCTCV